VAVAVSLGRRERTLFLPSPQPVGGKPQFSGSLRDTEHVSAAIHASMLPGIGEYLDRNRKKVCDYGR